jgi:site-specific DNA recombinase
VRALESQAVALRSRLDSLAGFYAQGLIDAQQHTEGTKEINVALAAVRDNIGKIYDGSALAGIIDTDDAGSAWLEAQLDRKRAVLDALATVTLLRGAQGRPAGWQHGQTYFRPELVKIEWKRL